MSCPQTCGSAAAKPLVSAQKVRHPLAGSRRRILHRTQRPSAKAMARPVSKSAVAVRRSSVMTSKAAYLPYANHRKTPGEIMTTSTRTFPSSRPADADRNTLMERTIATCGHHPSNGTARDDGFFPLPELPAARAAVRCSDRARHRIGSSLCDKLILIR